MRQSATWSVHPLPLARVEQQQLLQSLLERRVDQVGRGLLSLSQALGQLQQVDAAQRGFGSPNQGADTACVDMSAQSRRPGFQPGPPSGGQRRCQVPSDKSVTKSGEKEGSVAQLKS